MRCSGRRASARRLQGLQAASKGFVQQAARRLRAAADRGRKATMKHVATLVGAAAALAAWAQEATLKFAPEDLPVPSPPIADCAMDFKERGRPIEQPVDPAHVADLRTALDLDIRGIEPEGLAGFRMLEPVCFYLHPGRQNPLA